jgi:hypothetical protein
VYAATQFLIPCVPFIFHFSFHSDYHHQYWEATTQVYQMTSKWLDSAICLASFHYQCDQYKDRRPLTFGGNPRVQNVTRERERLREQNEEQTETLLLAKSQSVRGGMGNKKKHFSSIRKRFAQSEGKTAAAAKRPGVKSFKPNRRVESQVLNYFTGTEGGLHSLVRTPQRNVREWRSSFAAHRDNKDARNAKRILVHTGLDSPTPSLFLQEAAHLYSLLSAVAMATLRYDIEGTQSPLADYIPGRPFPPVNPDELHIDIKYTYHETSKAWTFIHFCLGIERSPMHRTLYNAARPFLVIGGVSDKECELLMAAHGPYAQMALCNMWLKEFVSREYLHGSTGAVAPPIVARVFQFISDGVVGYNQSRKIAYVPFPFPHAQMTVFFSLTILFIFPLLYHSFVNNVLFACVMNFTTVLCLIGTHEVARELENPYFTVPNDLPLNNFQVQFNEALIAGMLAGFHPDSWRIEEDERAKADILAEIEEEEKQEEEKEAERAEEESVTQHA